MPHILDDTDILERPSPSPECDEIHALPLVLPSSRRVRSRFLAFLRRLTILMRRSGTHQQGYCAPGAPRFETPLDLLARNYPDLHLRLMSGMG